MEANTNYILFLRAYDWTNPELNVNSIAVGIDYVAPEDDGNGVEVSPNNTWDDGPWDLVFYVYGEEIRSEGFGDGLVCIG